MFVFQQTSVLWMTTSRSERCCLKVIILSQHSKCALWAHRPIWFSLWMCSATERVIRGIFSHTTQIHFKSIPLLLPIKIISESLRPPAFHRWNLDRWKNLWFQLVLLFCWFLFVLFFCIGCLIFRRKFIYCLISYYWRAGSKSYHRIANKI